MEEERRRYARSVNSDGGYNPTISERRSAARLDDAIFPHVCPGIGCAVCRWIDEEPLRLEVRAFGSK